MRLSVACIDFDQIQYALKLTRMRALLHLIQQCLWPWSTAPAFIIASRRTSFTSHLGVRVPVYRGAHALVFLGARALVP